MIRPPGSRFSLPVYQAHSARTRRSGLIGGLAAAPAAVSSAHWLSEMWIRRAGWPPGSPDSASRAAAYTWARHWLTSEARSPSARSRAVFPALSRSS